MHSELLDCGDSSALFQALTRQRFKVDRNQLR
jgi:hypothetical protein